MSKHQSPTTPHPSTEPYVFIAVEVISVFSKQVPPAKQEYNVIILEGNKKKGIETHIFQAGECSQSQ